MSTQQNQPSSSTFKDSLFYLKDYIPFLSILAILISYFIPGVILKPEVIGALLFFLLWILYLAYKAYHAFGSTRPAPAPRALWQIIFNQLPPQVGKKREGNIPKILIISDEKTRETVALIREIYAEGDHKGDNNTHKEHGDQLLKIENFEYVSEYDEKHFNTLLRTVDAIYFFLTEKIKGDREFYETVNQWAIDNPHKPVLVVNFLPRKAKYNLTFNHIPAEEAESGLWQLLARSTERANQLRLQATTFRRIWLGTSLIVFLITAGFLWSAYESSKRAEELKHRDSIGVNELESLWASLEKVRWRIETLSAAGPGTDLSVFDTAASKARSSLVSQTDKDMFDIAVNKIRASLEPHKEKSVPAEVITEVRSSLNEYANYALKDLMHRQGIEEGRDKPQLTFWRKYKDVEDGKTYARQVAWSGSFDDDCFPSSFDVQKNGYTYLIGGALERQSFVMWRSDFKKGEPASWSNKGEVNGTWDVDKYNNGFVRFLDGQKCFYTPVPPPKKDNYREGLICLGVSSSDGRVESGVCLDTPKQPGFLQTEWTRNYLYRALSIMHLLPDDLLITHEMRKKCREWR